MKRSVYKLQKAGSLNNLKLTIDFLPDPRDNEVTIEVKSIGLNFADVFGVHGLYEAAPKNNFIPGLEFSGVVIEKGEFVKEFNHGDKVIGITKFGAYSTHINLDKRYLIKLPDDWSFEEGAAFIVQALTAYYAIKVLGNIKSGQLILIHSVAGGVGIYANRIAKKFNCTTIGTIGNENKIKVIANEDVNHIVVRDDNFIKNIKDILSDKHLDLILEALTGKYFMQTFNLLVPQGRAVIYGASNFVSHSASPNFFQLAYKYLTRPKIDILKLIQQNRSVMAFNLIWLYEKADYLRMLVNEILNLKLKKPFIGEVYKFDQLPIAIHKFQSGKTCGKIVVNL